MEEWLKLVYGWGYDTAQPGDAARMRPLKVDDPYIACAVGDEAVVQTAIDVDPQFVNRPGGSLAMPPLVAVTFSSLIRLPEFSEALRRCAKLLLDRGADANQTWINPQYPDSPLSLGRAGKVRGGDRLPWVSLSASDDNFAPLASLAWQAHVYGEVRASATTACRELHIPLHAFAWSREAARAGLARSALYLVRPDGYVALANDDGSANGLREYLANRELTPAAGRLSQREQ